MIRTDTIKQTTIKMLGRRALHGYEIHRALEAQEMKIGIGRLYEILKQLYEDGYLEDNWKDSPSGPKKRIYRLSEKGRNARESILMDAINTVHEFYGEYMRNLPSEKNPFVILSNKIARELEPDSTVGYIVNKMTRPVTMVLKNLQISHPDAKIYLIGSRDVTADNEIESISNLEGACNDIPTKDEFFDLLVLPGFNRIDAIDLCVMEWNRVLKPNGRVSIASPSVLLSQPEDPLNIGEFIEIREHPSRFSENNLTFDNIKSLLLTQFEKIETDSVVHIKIISATKSS